MGASTAHARRERVEGRGGEAALYVAQLDPVLGVLSDSPMANADDIPSGPCLLASGGRGAGADMCPQRGHGCGGLDTEGRCICGRDGEGQGPKLLPRCYQITGRAISLWIDRQASGVSSERSVRAGSRMPRSRSAVWVEDSQLATAGRRAAIGLRRHAHAASTTTSRCRSVPNDAGGPA